CPPAGGHQQHPSTSGGGEPPGEGEDRRRALARSGCPVHHMVPASQDRVLHGERDVLRGTHVPISPSGTDTAGTGGTVRAAAVRSGCSRPRGSCAAASPRPPRALSSRPDAGGRAGGPPRG